MKKIRKIVALALATVMMMAMSITAFAAEGTASFEVTNLASDEATTLKIYEIATTKNGDWDFAKWIPSDAITKKTENNKTEYVFDWAKIATAAQDETAKDTYETKATNGKYETSHTFTGLTGAAYLVLAAGTEYTYNPMGQSTYEYSNGAYQLKDASVKAKSSNVPVHKTADKQFVHVGDVVSFDIETSVPNEATSFVVTDSSVNLENFVLKKITVAGVEQTLSDYTLVTVSDDEHTIDLSALLADKEKVGDKVVITIEATVGANIVLSEGEVEGFAFKNSAWSNLGTPKDTPDVVGYTGDITLTKYDDDENVLKGAKFNVYKTVDNKKVYAKFDFVKTGEYKFAGFTNVESEATEIEATDGTVKVTGLSAGEYGFHETVAPEGYQLNATDSTATVESSLTANTHATTLMTDTKLISLPFTGGMGTTIFTVLGVAIMAMASALYFATKKKATK